MARKGKKYTGKELKSMTTRKNKYYKKLYSEIHQDYKNGLSVRQLSYKYHSYPGTIKKAIDYCEEV